MRNQVKSEIPGTVSCFQKIYWLFITFNTFHATSLFLYPLMMFSRGIERGQWHEMGYNDMNTLSTWLLHHLHYVLKSYYFLIT